MNDVAYAATSLIFAVMIYRIGPHLTIIVYNFEHGRYSTYETEIGSKFLSLSHLGTISVGCLPN